jgi:hypothetical protein
MLWAGVESPCLHRPGNWLVRQLNEEPKPVYKVVFVREKEKATAKYCSGARKAGVFMEILTGLDGFFSLAVDLRAFSGELVWFVSLLGEGKQS